MKSMQNTVILALITAFAAGIPCSANAAQKRLAIRQAQAARAPKRPALKKPAAKVKPQQPKKVIKKPAQAAPKKIIKPTQFYPQLITANSRISTLQAAFSNQRILLEMYKNNHTASVKSRASAVSKKTTTPKKAVSTPAMPQGLIIERVAQQSGADCGYHALYNGWRKSLELQGYEQPALPLEQWRQTIINRRNANIHIHQHKMQRYAQAVKHARETNTKCKIEVAPNAPGPIMHGEFIDDGEIELLANNAGIDQDSFSVVANPELLNPTFVDAAGFEHPVAPEYQLNIPATIHRLQTQEGAVHAFILGNMRHANDNTGSWGHWIAVVVHRVNDRLRYYVMDSIGGNHLGSVNVLKNVIEPGSAPFVVAAPKRVTSKKPAPRKTAQTPVRRPVVHTPTKQIISRFSPALIKQHLAQARKQNNTQPQQHQTRWFVGSRIMGYIVAAKDSLMKLIR